MAKRLTKLVIEEAIKAEEQSKDTLSKLIKQADKGTDQTLICEDNIFNIITKLRRTTKTNEKKQILLDNKDNVYLREYLKIVYDPFTQYYIKKIPDYQGQSIGNLTLSSYVGFEEFKTFFGRLAKREITGNTAIAHFIDFVKKYEKYSQELINLTILRDVSAGINTSLINSVWSGLLTEFSVALGKALSDKNMTSIQFGGETPSLASTKLDGLRFLAIHDGQKYRGYSRTGKEIQTAKRILDEITTFTRHLKEKPVFDGECCIVLDNGVEDFKSIMTEWSRKNHTMENPKYFIFDYLTREEFDSQTSTRIFSERIEQLKKDWLSSNNVYNHLDIVEQIPLQTQDQLTEFREKMEKDGREGVIVRLDREYVGKRSEHIIKIKEFSDAEYKIVDVEIGTITFPGENGIDTFTDALTNVIIEHKGTKVSVGSGFSKKQRTEEFNGEKSKLLIGSTITIKYFEESQSKDGSWSLRFPTVKALFLGSERDN